jgi:hypothetical protein
VVLDFFVNNQDIRECHFLFKVLSVLRYCEV